MNLSHHTVLITGGTSGIGLALAQRFLRANNAVIVTGRDEGKLATVRDILPGVIAVQADMTNRQSLKRLAASYPQVNVLINNAGVQYNYEFDDLTAADELLDIELDTNLYGPLYLTRQFLPELRRKESAAIVNVSSVMSILPKQSAPVYGASKAGLHSFTKALRWQLEDTNVKVFEVVPPLVDTAMTAGRGTGKITPEALADEFWQAFAKDVYEIRIGKSKLIHRLHRWMPGLAEQQMRGGR